MESIPVEIIIMIFDYCPHSIIQGGRTCRYMRRALGRKLFTYNDAVKEIHLLKYAISMGADTNKLATSLVASSDICPRVCSYLLEIYPDILTATDFAIKLARQDNVECVDLLYKYQRDNDPDGPNANWCNYSVAHPLVYVAADFYSEIVTTWWIRTFVCSDDKISIKDIVSRMGTNDSIRDDMHSRLQTIM